LKTIDNNQQRRESILLKTTAIGFIIAGLTLLAATAVAVLATQERLQEARASANWPTADGVVVRTTRSRSMGVHVSYRYSVAGIDYESNRIRLAEKFWRDQPSEIAARYPEGRQVSVAYDPSNPSSAALEPGASWGAIVKKLIAALLLGIAGLGLILVGALRVRR
jgi:hypothetical protein